jgi:hypothetical protein
LMDEGHARSSIFWPELVGNDRLQGLGGRFTIVPTARKIWGRQSRRVLCNGYAGNTIVTFCQACAGKALPTSRHTRFLPRRRSLCACKGNCNCDTQ